MSEKQNSQRLPYCLLEEMAGIMESEPGLEAVEIRRDEKAIRVATLGQAREEVKARVAEKVEIAQERRRERNCGLLEGSSNCSGCVIPSSPAILQEYRVHHEGQNTTIARVTCPTAPKLWRWQSIPWPRFVQREIPIDEDADLEEWKGQLLAAVLCLCFIISANLIAAAELAVASYLLAYIAGAWDAAQDAWEKLKKRTVDVHFLMLAVAGGSAAIGAWNEGAILLFLFSFSGALEHYAFGRTQREIRSLFKDSPKTAVVLEEGHEREAPVEELKPGMRLLIKPGAQFPVDAEVVSGETAADESNLTGEAIPVEKRKGDPLFAGSLNLWGAVEASVLRPASESSLQKIIRLIRDAQRNKAPAQSFTDRFSASYTYFALSLSLVMFFVWHFGFGLPAFTSEGGQSAFYRTMILLVVASPCALVLSIPSAVLAAIAWSAKRGILFRGGAAVEKLAGIDLVALDKTGTLTTGELKVEEIESFPPGKEKELLQLAFSMELLSNHPLARAVVRHGKKNNIQRLSLENFQSLTGQGVKAKWNGKECLLGSRQFFSQTSKAKAVTQIPQTPPGISEVWVGADQLLGRILLRDDIRPEAKAILEQLTRSGLRTVVLTGDRKAAAEHLRQQLPVDEIRAELTPEEKVRAIESFAASGHHAAMIGDGVNDAPSLAAAHVGVAMGARGADAALEQADVVLMNDRLENFFAAYSLSKRARNIIRQNLVISLGTVAVLAVLALIGIIPLTVGVVGHEGSTVLVVANSLRLLFGGGTAGTAVRGETAAHRAVRSE